MRVERLSCYVALLIGCSLSPILFLYFSLPNTNVLYHTVQKELDTVTPIIFDLDSLDPSVCQLSKTDQRNYPNCLPKIKWLQENWEDHQCFAENSVNGSFCSSRFYLSHHEYHCPPLSENPNFAQFEPNTNVDDLFKHMIDNSDNYIFIKTRISKLWPTWIRSLNHMKKKYPRQFSNYRKLNIIVHLGFLMKESKLNFATKSKAGGPLGELVQWSDLIAVLHLLGHNLYLTTDKQALLLNIKKFYNASPCPGPEHLDLIITDIMGFLRIFRKQRTFAAENSCKFRFVDSFGTHAEFNNKQFFLKIRKSLGGSPKNPWGGHGLRLKQYWTFYPHTSDNSFLGFVIEGDGVPPLFPRESRKAVLIYGKEQYMWDNKSHIISTLLESFEVHATVADAAKDNPVFDKVVNHGFLNQTQLSALLKSMVAFVGLGFPLEGPASLEAIAAGAAFINPSFDPPQWRGNTQFLSEKPTLRKWTSQVPYLERIGEPYVYTVNMREKDELRKTMDKVLSQKRTPFVPLDFQPLGMLLRVNQMLLNQDLCVSLTRHPPPSELKMPQNAPSPKNRLHQLCCSRSPMALEVVRSLLSKGSNPRERGDEGLTPLHAAAAYDNIAICQLLLHFGADVSAKDDLDRTPLTMATGNTKIFLARYIEKDRRTRRGLLRRIFVCQAGIYSPEQKQSFVKDLRSRVRSFGMFKRRESKTKIIAATEVSVAEPLATPRRRARTPEILERMPKTAVKLPKRSKTPDFEPDIKKKGSQTPDAPKFDPVTRRTPRGKNLGTPSQPSVIVITPKKNVNKVPPRKMVTPSAPPLTPQAPAKVITATSSAPNVTTRRGRKINISSESEYITAEESLETEELEKRLSQLQIGINEPAVIDESKLREVRRLKDVELRIELQKLGIAAGPICSRTRKLYEKKLLAAIAGYNAVVKDTKKYSRQLEMAFNGKFDILQGQKLDEAIKAEFNNTGVTSFVYILIDPRILGSETKPSLKLFVEALFYIGKGTKARPLQHLIDAKRLKLEKSSTLETSKKFSRINSIWNSGHGVGLLELSHTISDKEAFTREAAFIEALRLENLCNIKGGEWHGITRQWDIVSRATLGVYLMEQARTILHTLSVRRVFPEDLPDSLYPFVNTRRR